MSAIAEPRPPSPPAVDAGPASLATSPLRLAGAALGLLAAIYGVALFTLFRNAPERLVSDGVRALFRAGGPLRDLVNALPLAALSVLAAWLLLGLVASRRRAAPLGPGLVDAARALWPLCALALTLWFDDPAGRQVLAAAVVGLVAFRAWPLLGASPGSPSPLFARLAPITRPLTDPRHPHRAPALLCLAATAFLFYGAAARHAAHWSSLIDLGLFYELYDNAAGSLLFSPTLGQSFLGEHFSPVLVLLWPVMELFPSPLTLLAIQSLAIGGGAWLLYRLAHDRTGHVALSALLMLAWAVSPYVQAAAFYDFHMDMLEPPMLFGLVLALHRRRPLWVAVCAVLLWCTKEDTFLYTSVLGVYAIAFLGQRKTGALLIAVGLAQAALVLGVVLPALRAPFDPAFFSTTGPQEGYAFLGRYSHLGSSVPAIAGQVLANPLYVLDHLTTGARLTNVLALLLTFGGLALFAGWRIILLAPVAEMLLANAGPMSSFHFYYGAVAFMFAPLAAIEGARRLLRRPPDAPVFGPLPPGRLATALAALLVALLAWHPTSWLSAEHTYKPVVQTPHHAAADALIAAIPPGARVTATGYQAVHLQPDRDVRMFPYGLDAAEHVLVDLQRPPWPRTLAGVQDELLRLPRQGFRLAAHADGLLHLVRDPAAAPDPAAAAAERDRLRAHFEDITFEAELSEQTAFMSGAHADPEASNGAFRRARAADRRGPDFLAYGPYLRLAPGPYRAHARVRWRDRGLWPAPADRVVATVDVTAQHGRASLAKRDLRAADLADGAWLDVALDFTVAGARPATTGERFPPGSVEIEVRAFFHGVGELDLDFTRVTPAEAR